MLNPRVENIRPHSSCGLLKQFDQTILQLQSISLFACKTISFELKLSGNDQQQSIKHRRQGLEHMKVQRSADEN